MRKQTKHSPQRLTYPPTPTPKEDSRLVRCDAMIVNDVSKDHGALIFTDWYPGLGMLDSENEASTTV